MSTSASTAAPVIRLHAPVPFASVQGSLALDLSAREEPPFVPVPAARFDVIDPEPASRERLDAFIHRYLQAAVEIAIGDRPARQVLRHCVPVVYDDLVARATRVRTAAGSTAARGRGPGAVRPVVLSVRTSMAHASAVEASAHVRYGQRSRAVAARFEEMQQRWQCVELEWG